MTVSGVAVLVLAGVNWIVASGVADDSPAPRVRLGCPELRMAHLSRCPVGLTMTWSTLGSVCTAGAGPGLQILSVRSTLEVGSGSDTLPLTVVLPYVSP